MVDAEPTLAVLGGSGLYAMAHLEAVRELEVHTPFGPPSDAIVEGRFEAGGARLLFLPRHGRAHTLPPSSINYRANICALKMCGATHLLAVSAVGSMREDIAPGDVVVVDQYIDLTKRRISTFFDADAVAHVSFADPVCAQMSRAVVHAARAALSHAAPAGRVPQVHPSGTYVCIEGPQFSTRAESMLYRSWSVSVIGMTGMPEAKLAREAELPFAAVALATDYDCWHHGEEPVSVEAIVGVLRANAALAQHIVRELAGRLPERAASAAASALDKAILTSPSLIAPPARQRLDWLIGKYLAS